MANTTPSTRNSIPHLTSAVRLPSYMRSMMHIPGTKPRPIAVPQDFLVRDLKDKRKFRLLSRKLTVFVSFVSIYVAVLLMDRNISGRSFVRRILSTELLETSRATSGVTFTSIHSAGLFWDWLANSFLPLVYSTTTSDGLNRTTDELYTIAAHTRIVGGFHMVQTRYAKRNTSSDATRGNVCYSTLAATQNSTCFVDSDDSMDAFGFIDNATTAGSVQPALTNQSMFQYTTLESFSGFQTVFLRSLSQGADERARIDAMQAYRWVDRQTRTVEIDMAMYNPNLKLWSIVDLTIDFDLAGGVTPSAFIHVTNLEPYDVTNRHNVIRVILEALFVAHVLYFILLEFWDVCVLSNGNWREYMVKYGIVNNLGDWGNIITNVSICIWRYLCQHNTTRQRLLSLENFDEYVPATSLALWDDVLLALNICNMLLLTVRALKYFQVTNGGRRLMYSVYGAMPEVLSFLPIYCSVITGYAFAGHLLYGLNFPDWATFPRALFRVFELNFGLYDPGAIYDDGGYLSAIFIYSSNVVFCILMLNVFMAIVMSTWEQLSEKEAEKADERASYSTRLGIWGSLQLVLMKEVVVDMLIDTAIALEGSDGVTKQAFTKEWKVAGIDVSPATWDRICGWYWDPVLAEAKLTKDEKQGHDHESDADATEIVDVEQLDAQRKSATISPKSSKKYLKTAKIAAAPSLDEDDE